MEIEKKYLVEKIDFDLKSYTKKEIEQSYICQNPTTRIRKINNSYILTFKDSSKIEENMKGEEKQRRKRSNRARQPHNCLVL